MKSIKKYADCLEIYQEAHQKGIEACKTRPPPHQQICVSIHKDYKICLVLYNLNLIKIKYGYARLPCYSIEYAKAFSSTLSQYGIINSIEYLDMSWTSLFKIMCS